MEMDTASAYASGGGKKGSPKPEAILKYAHHPIAMLAGLWEKEREEWQKAGTDPRPPVFILVCKNTRIAKVIYECWLKTKPRQAFHLPALKVSETRMGTFSPFELTRKLYTRRTAKMRRMMNHVGCD